VAALAGVRIESAHQDARSFQSEALDQIPMQDVDHAPSESRVMAALTAASGRCVVASATRRPGVASIITGSARQRSARNSVCPLKGMPASLMTPLCTGPVTRASKVRSRQPSQARLSVSST
jgi:hypothetical protein